MTDAVVIDTNVLEHAFDPMINGDGHVNSLLRKFSEQRRKLCVDRPAANAKSRILAEYHHRLAFHLREMEDRDQLTQWLRYVVVVAERVDIPVNLSDGLGCDIVPLMNRVGAERSDQIFVYVACILNSVMVSNNARHVTNLRGEFRRAARRIRCRETDFLSSSEAEASM